MSFTSSLRYCTPLLPPALILYSALNSKSAGLPARQIRNEFDLICLVGVTSPIKQLLSIRQTLVSPSHPLNVFPSKICVKPSLSVLSVFATSALLALLQLVASTTNEINAIRCRKVLEQLFFIIFIFLFD